MILTTITLKKYITLLFALFLTSMGIALAIKSGVGLAAFDAFNQSLSHTTGARVGDIVMYVQMFFVIIQLLVLRKDVTWHILLQIPFVILLGQFINLFVYGVFGNLVLNNYFLRLLVFMFSQVWISLSISIMIVLDLIAMPIENLSLILSRRMTFSFGKIRQSIDILLIVLSLGITLIFSVDFTVREGTLIAALIFGPLMDFIIPKLEPYFRKWNLIQ